LASFFYRESPAADALPLTKSTPLGCFVGWEIGTTRDAFPCSKFFSQFIEVGDHTFIRIVAK